jgi:hypothetical protein
MIAAAFSQYVGSFRLRVRLGINLERYVNSRGIYSDVTQLHEGRHDDIFGSYGGAAMFMPRYGMPHEFVFWQHPMFAGLSGKTAVIDEEGQVRSLTVPAFTKLLLGLIRRGMRVIAVKA